MMKVLRAHYYDHVQQVNNRLSVLPHHWSAAIENVGWVLLPDDLSPLYVGLLPYDYKTHDGRWYSTCGGWAHTTDHLSGDYGAFWKVPHVYLNRRVSCAAAHEAAHHLHRAWHAPVEQLFKPDAALYDYMASNPAEYFACAVDAFLVPERDDARWNNHDLAKSDVETWRYLNQRLNGEFHSTA